MRVASEKDITNYKLNKRATLRRLGIASFCFVVATAMILLGGHLSIDILWIFGVIVGLLALGFAINDKWTPYVDPQNDLYPLLERWEKFSGSGLKHFPTSEMQARAMEQATRSRAWALAAKVIEAHEKHEQLRADAEEFFRKEGAVDIPTAKRNATDYERLIAQQKDKYDELRIYFLGFWGLMIEKGGGIGILWGSEWDNPESFLRTVAGSRSTVYQKS